MQHRSNLAQVSQAGMGAIAQMSFEESLMYGVRCTNKWVVECLNADGEHKWTETIHNLVVDLGLDYMVNIGLDAGTQITTWYCGFTDGTPSVAAGDTMSSHAGWVDTDVYSEANRPTITFANTGTGQVDNSAAQAVFNINAGGTIGGAFVTSDNTVSGTAGTLYGAGAFTGGDRTVANNDTVNVTITCTAAAA